jgi:hypothetical protein
MSCCSFHIVAAADYGKISLKLGLRPKICNPPAGSADLLVKFAARPTESLYRLFCRDFHIVVVTDLGEILPKLGPRPETCNSPVGSVDFLIEFAAGPARDGDVVDHNKVIAKRTKSGRSSPPVLYHLA